MVCVRKTIPDYVVLLVVVLPVALFVFPGTGIQAAEPLRIAAVGDIMMGTTYPREDLPPEDGKGIFDGVEPLLKGHDIVFGNLEGPLIDGGKARKCKPGKSGKNLCFEFRMPTRYAGYLRDAGFNVANITNNHLFDFGEEGVNSTLKALGLVSVKPVGGEQVARFAVKGGMVAVVGFSFCAVPPYGYSILDIEGAKAVVASLKKEKNLVIVSFHGGAEGKQALRLPEEAEYFAGEARGDVARFSRSVIEAGADLVLGHGPHVPRALEIYRGKLIAYSLGNFCTYGTFNIRGPNGLSFILQASLDPETGDFLSGKIVPLRLENRGIPVLDEGKESVRLIRELTEKDGRSTSVLIADDGEVRPFQTASCSEDPLPLLTIPFP